MTTDQTIFNPLTPELITAAEMRALEQAAIESGAVTGLELMERAGQAVAQEIIARRPTPARAAVLCGPGNNGGDGYVIARALQEQGWTVSVFALGDPDRLPPDAKTNYDRWREMGDVAPFAEAAGTPLTRGDVVVDALFGAGLARSIGEEILDIFYKVTSSSYISRLLVVAVDAPSGLCMDSGRPLGPSPSGYAPSQQVSHADLTITFHRPRLGHVLAEGPKICGRIVIKDIGLTETPEDSALRASPSFLDKGMGSSGHKYDHGHVLVVSGPMGRTGAARLAARAALRAGAGLVTIASPPSAMLENACHLTAIMLRKMRGPEGLAEILEDRRINTIVIGPGCGVGEQTRAMVKTVLKTRRRAVLDADALTSFADDPDALFSMLDYNVVLTPHAGEFARLFPDIAARLDEEPTRSPAYSKVDAARDAAGRCGARVLFKGPDTVVADPDRWCAIAAAVYDKAAPWLATAGSGDVLAGLIAGLENDLAGAAALHQALGRHCGPGLIAEDLPEAIPVVFAKLAAGEQI